MEIFYPSNHILKLKMRPEVIDNWQSRLSYWCFPSAVSGRFLLQF